MSGSGNTASTLFREVKIFDGRARHPDPRPGPAARTTPSPLSGLIRRCRGGALADLLLVDGNPLQDLSLVATPDTSFGVIMKDGRIYKNERAS
jgi:hypothetical protein